jgi:hypothetical protein
MTTEPAQVSLSHPELSDFLVLKKTDVQRLMDAVNDLWNSASEDGCEAPYFVADKTFMDATLAASRALRGAKPLDQALRRVDGDMNNREEPILVVLPQGVDDKTGVDLMNAAIEGANQDSNFGKKGDYFERLQTRLGASGIAVTSGVEQLFSKPWDADVFSGPLSADEDYVDVMFSCDEYEPDQLDPVVYQVRNDKADEDSPLEVVPDVPFAGFCTELDVTYPRAAKYGVPDMATESGAAEYVKETLKFSLHRDFSVFATDSGDDSGLMFKVRALVHKDCLRPVQAPVDRPREGGQ